MLIKTVDLFIGPAAVHLWLRKEPNQVFVGNTSPTLAYFARPLVVRWMLWTQLAWLANIHTHQKCEPDRTRLVWLAGPSTVQIGLLR